MSFSAAARYPFVVLAVALVAACSSVSDGGVAAPPPPDRSGALPGYPTTADTLTPLIITPLAPDPVPVTGTDGKVHVAYELQVLNFSPRVATLTRLETLAGGPNGRVVATVEGDALTGRTFLVMDAKPRLNAEVPVGRTSLILVDDVYDTEADVPVRVTPRLSATFAPAAAEYASSASLYPGDAVSLVGKAVTTGTTSPVVIGPPLTGVDWVAYNGCCGFSSHRYTTLPIGGRINGSERYAIDWFRYDLAVDPTTLPEGLSPSFRGDPRKNENYLAYDAPLLAVADGTVVTVVSDVPDSVPQVLPSGLAVGDAGGNVVTLDIGGGVYASYAHLVPGSRR